jgi:hypothetical protein
LLERPCREDRRPVARAGVVLSGQERVLPLDADPEIDRQFLVAVSCPSVPRVGVVVIGGNTGVVDPICDGVF